jgi:hypothetical protein
MEDYRQEWDEFLTDQGVDHTASNSLNGDEILVVHFHHILNIRIDATKVRPEPIYRLLILELWKASCEAIRCRDELVKYIDGREAADCIVYEKGHTS